jgi:hypothetical protein
VGGEVSTGLREVVMEFQRRLGMESLSGRGGNTWHNLVASFCVLMGIKWCFLDVYSRIMMMLIMTNTFIPGPCGVITLFGPTIFSARCKERHRYASHVTTP